VQKVEFEIRNKGGRPKKKAGELLAEYEHFYLIQMGKYRETISKADLICGHIKLKIGGRVVCPEQKHISTKPKKKTLASCLF
jgi:hypothetical protein